MAVWIRCWLQDGGMGAGDDDTRDRDGVPWFARRVAVASADE